MSISIMKPEMQGMKNVFVILLTSILFTACSKENSDSFFPYPTIPANDTAWVQQVPVTAPVNKLMESLSLPSVVDSFNVQVGATIRASEFLQVTFPPNCFAFANGATYTGNAKVEVIHLRRKGDMVRYSRPTTSFGRLLKSGGAFFVRATKDGQELILATNKQIKLKFTDPTPVNDMRVFYGIEGVQPPFPAGTNPSFTWTPAQDSSRISTFQQFDSTLGIIRGYELLSQKLRWVNADYFTDTTQTIRTRLDVLLPLNFTNANTSVFAVFTADKTVVQLNPEISSRSFNTVNIPVGRSVTLISLSKIGDVLYMSTRSIVTANNHPESLIPEIKTKAQILQFLDNL